MGRDNYLRPSTLSQALAASKNSKKSWEILKEAASLRKNTHKVTEIAPTARQQQMALK
jgi:hypothetical protein